MTQPDSFDKAAQLLRQQMEEGFVRAEKTRESLLEHIKRTKIYDHLVDQRALHFVGMRNGTVLMTFPDVSWLTLHRHALRQACNKTRLPVSYADYLIKQEDWGVRLLGHTLSTLVNNTRFSQKRAHSTLLVRQVEDDARALLSRSYAIHLSTDPLLHRFLDYTVQAGAKFAGALWSGVRIQVCVLMPYLYEAFHGQYLQVGMAFHNSDFGAGTFTVSQSLTNPITGLSMHFGEPLWEELTNKELFRKIHLGPALTIEDDRVVQTGREDRLRLVSDLMYEEVQKKLSPDWIQAVCRAVARAETEHVSWPSTKRALSTRLVKEEVKRIESMLKKQEAGLPALLAKDVEGMAVPTYWWLANAIAKIASETTEVDRKIELQQEAGKYVTKERIA